MTAYDEMIYLTNKASEETKSIRETMKNHNVTCEAAGENLQNTLKDMKGINYGGLEEILDVRFIESDKGQPSSFIENKFSSSRVASFFLARDISSLDSIIEDKTRSYVIVSAID
jgi:hypothetical protein